MLADGATLSAIDSVRSALGVKARILPMSDERVATMLETDEERMPLQDYSGAAAMRAAPAGNEFAGADGAGEHGVGAEALKAPTPS